MLTTSGWTLAAAIVLATRCLTAQDSSSRAGRRAVLPREQEIALARSAAPASVSARATILVLTDTGYAVAVEGTSGVVCVVNRSWRDSVEPHCYDSEAAATILPIEMTRLRLREAGRAEADIEHEIAAGLTSGRFRLPQRPAMSYMMSAGQLLYDDAGKRVGPWRPHVMLYYPGLTNEALGFASTPDMHVGMVSESGGPEANLMMIMPGFVEVPDSKPAAGPPTAAAPCANDPDRRRLDFWVGTWDVTTPGGYSVGSSTVQVVSGGCAILERWTSRKGANGNSLSTFNTNLHQWQQYWIGQDGGVTEYRESTWSGNALTLVARSQSSVVRMTIAPVDAKSVRQLGESSTDGGKSWSTSYDFVYHRRS